MYEVKVEFGEQAGFRSGLEERLRGGLEEGDNQEWDTLQVGHLCSPCLTFDRVVWSAVECMVLKTGVWSVFFPSSTILLYQEVPTSCCLQSVDLVTGFLPGCRPLVHTKCCVFRQDIL